MIFDGLVCDLDGVVYRSDAPIDGAVDALAELRRGGTRIVFCTNNSRPTLEQYVDKLSRMGVDAEEKEVVTSSIVTAEVLSKRGFSGSRAVVVGGEGLHRALSSVGIGILTGHSDAVDIVAVGWDPNFHYSDMRRALRALLGGAEFVATNDDATFPASDGVWPGAGAILASIEAASGKSAEVMGKPHRPMMETAARRLEGCRRIAVVGDRPETDLAGGRAMGWTTILVLSGVTASAGAVDPKPDVVVESLAALVRRR